MWQYPLAPPPEYINFFETISILAGDHLVVPIGVSYMSLRHKKYNQESGRNENNEQKRDWVNSSARRVILWHCAFLCACLD